MDPNGTRYHLLLSHDDWLGGEAVCTPAGDLVHDVSCGLRLRSEPYRYAVPEGDPGPTLAARRGAAADRFHNLYWVDDAGTGIRVRSAGSGQTSLFWDPRTGADVHEPVAGGFGPAAPEPAPPPGSLSGLTVTEDHYLVVGTQQPAGLLVFDLYQPASRTQELWPADVPFEPFDLCARTGGGVFVLDRTHRRLWELDTRLEVVTDRPAADPHPADFVAVADEAPDDGASEVRATPCLPRSRPEVGDASALTGDPWAVESAPGGRVLLLVRADEPDAPSELRALVPRTGSAISVPLVDARDPSDPLVVVGHDLARVDLPDTGSTPGALGRVLVADQYGNQSYAFDLTEVDGVLQAVLSEDAWPMRLFGGKGLISDGDRAWYDVGDGWVVLVPQWRRRYVESAVLETGALDAGVAGTVWHRLLLDARIPPGCRVSAQSRSADEVDDLREAPWRDEPAFDYQRTQGSELAFEADEVTAAGWATWEVLLQHGVGRHLQLRVELSGDVRETPWLRALRIYYPRFSYVDRYLPGVYQADDESASFLTRFLANTEGILTDIEGRIVAAQALLDPRTAPESALGWLFGWFDLAADPTWDAERRRLFLRHATAFLGLRGTELGIVTALRLALDDCLDDSLFGPLRTGRGGYRIVERFATRKAPVPGDVVAPDRTLGEQRSRWDPSQGRDDLIARWRAETGDADVDFPLSGGDQQWASFVERVLAVEPLVAVTDEEWQGFLRQRHGRIEDLNAAYGLVAPTTYPSFEAIAAPRSLPADGAPLVDWYHFAAVVVPARRGAHQFTVLLPVRRASGPDADAQRRRAIATRVVELQKPAHTTFGIRFFWSAFQVGSAVLGQDTQVELGGRDPQFHQSVVLGRDYAGESSLGGPPAPTGDRVGRDRLSS